MRRAVGQFFILPISDQRFRDVARQSAAPSPPAPRSPNPPPPPRRAPPPQADPSRRYRLSTRETVPTRLFVDVRPPGDGCHPCFPGTCVHPEMGGHRLFVDVRPPEDGCHPCFPRRFARSRPCSPFCGRARSFSPSTGASSRRARGPKLPNGRRAPACSSTRMNSIRVHYNARPGPASVRRTRRDSRAVLHLAARSATYAGYPDGGSGSGCGIRNLNGSTAGTRSNARRSPARTPHLEVRS